jgi:hypothetical protein
MDIDNPNNGLMESLASLIGNTPLLEIIFYIRTSLAEYSLRLSNIILQVASKIEWHSILLSRLMKVEP